MIHHPPFKASDLSGDLARLRRHSTKFRRLFRHLTTTPAITGRASVARRKALLKNVTHLLVQCLRGNTVEFIELLLLLPTPLSFSDRPLHRAGYLVRIEDRPTL